MSRIQARDAVCALDTSTKYSMVLRLVSPSRSPESSRLCSSLRKGVVLLCKNEVMLPGTQESGTQESGTQESGVRRPETQLHTQYDSPIVLPFTFYLLPSGVTRRSYRSRAVAARCGSPWRGG